VTDAHRQTYEQVEHDLDHQLARLMADPLLATRALVMAHSLVLALAPEASDRETRRAVNAACDAAGELVIELERATQ
jgi:hypothetical protein